MKKQKLRFDNFSYASFTTLLGALFDEDTVYVRVLNALQDHLEYVDVRYRFVGRPYSNYLRVTVLLVDEFDPKHTTVYGVLRLRFKPAEELTDGEIKFSGQLDAEDEPGKLVTLLSA